VCSSQDLGQRCLGIKDHGFSKVLCRFGRSFIRQRVHDAVYIIG
jgi:hypothetical protein